MLLKEIGYYYDNYFKSEKILSIKHRKYVTNLQASPVLVVYCGQRVQAGSVH